MKSSGRTGPVWVNRDVEAGQGPQWSINLLRWLDLVLTFQERPIFLGFVFPLSGYGLFTLISVFFSRNLNLSITYSSWPSPIKRSLRRHHLIVPMTKIGEYDTIRYDTIRGTSWKRSTQNVTINNLASSPPPPPTEIRHGASENRWKQKTVHKTTRRPC